MRPALAHRLSIAAMATLLLSTATLTHPARAADAPPPTKITADLGYVSTAGNSEVQTLTASDKIEQRHDRWLFSQDGAAVWGADHGVENAGRYGLALRADYAVSDRVGFYGLGSWRRNTFAGISRQFDEGVGAVYHALIPIPQQLDFEAGIGMAQRRSVTDAEDNFGTGRLAALYRYYFQEKSYLESKGVYLHNFKDSNDYEYDVIAALVAPLSAHFAAKIGYNYHYRNMPPIGFGRWDSTFSAGIQANW